MTTLITGATGYLGSAVVRVLHARGDNVRCLVRRRSDTRNLDGLRVERVYGDICDPASLARALSGCRRVYHLAARYTLWQRRSGDLYRVNEEGTRNVLTACRAAGVEKVVYCSSTAALGAHGRTPADESARFNLTDTRDAYYLSKFRAEQIARGFARQGLPVVIVNPSVPVGPRDIAPTPSGALIVNLLKGRFPAYVDGGLNLVDSDDCARAIVAAMAHGRPGENYVLGNLNLSVKEYFERIVAVAGHGRVPALRMPVWLAVMSGYGYQSLAWVTGRPPVTSASWVRVGSRYSWWDCSKARRELGLGQTPIETSLARAIAWFRDHGYL